MRGFHLLMHSPHTWNIGVCSANRPRPERPSLGNGGERAIKREWRLGNWLSAHRKGTQIERGHAITTRQSARIRRELVCELIGEIGAAFPSRAQMYVGVSLAPLGQVSCGTACSLAWRSGSYRRCSDGNKFRLSALEVHLIQGHS
jgi:hypothetical protein